MRSHKKFPSCLTDPALEGSQRGPTLTRSEPSSHGDGTLGIMDLRWDKKACATAAREGRVIFLMELYL